jgi:hypothetical protein
LVILERGFPPIFGLEIHDLIKKSGRHKEIPVLLLEDTAQADDDLSAGILSLPLDRIQELPLPTVAGLLPDRFEMEEARPPETGDPTETTADPGDFLSKEEMDRIEEAKRLARTIISDIILYNPEKTADGLQQGNLWDLLKEEVEEGRRLFQERIPPEEVHPARDYFQEALQDFLRKQGWGTPAADSPETRYSSGEKGNQPLWERGVSPAS